MWKMFKVNNKDTERRHRRCSGFFIVNLKHIWHLSFTFRSDKCLLGIQEVCISNPSGVAEFFVIIRLAFVIFS